MILFGLIAIYVVGVIVSIIFFCHTDYFISKYSATEKDYITAGMLVFLWPVVAVAGIFALPFVVVSYCFGWLIGKCRDRRIR